MRLRTLLVSALTTVALITGSGFAVTQAHESAETSDDASVTRSIQTRWRESGAVDDSRMNVVRSGGTVSLEGSARSEAEALLAEDIAARVHGVLKVDNRLSIQP